MAPIEALQNAAKLAAVKVGAATVALGRINLATNHSEVPSEATERVGTLLKDKYRLDSVLGVGGMAIVYAATHRNRKRFAVKVLRAELSVRAEIRGRFVREGYIANTVGHPGAVAVLDDDVASDGAAFLVMELLEGAGLEEVWERHSCTIPLRGALAVGWQLLDVLAAAHEKEIVHRDIKPANLFVTRDGTLKVLDFGIARLRDAASEHATQSGTAMGTPAFMPPEQVLGKASQIDALTDIWAVGATLFTLLSSHLVHEGETPQELMVRSATVRPRSLATVSRDLPPAVVGVIDRALEFDRAARWPSAVAMRDAIAECYRATFSENISTAPVATLLMARDGSAAPTVLGDTPQAATGGPPKARPSVPVAPTVDATKIAPAVDAAAVARTVAAPHVAQLIGMTTSQPVSIEMPPPLPGPTPQRPATAGRRRVGAIAAAVVLVALGSGLTTVLKGRGGATAQVSGVAEPPGAAAASSAAAGTTVALVPSPAVAEAASSTKVVPSAAVPVEIPPPTTRDPRLGTAPRVGATSSRAGAASPTSHVASSPGSAAPPATPAPSLVAKPNCDPPYTIDSAGRRVLKRECL